VKALQRDRRVVERLERDKEAKRQRAELRRAKKKLAESAHVRPNAATGIALERKLIQVATQGVVALFNATEKYRKSLEAKNGDAISKEGFMTMLKGSSAGSTADTRDPVKKRKWAALSEEPNEALSDDLWDGGPAEGSPGEEGNDSDRLSTTSGSDHDLDESSDPD